MDERLNITNNSLVMGLLKCCKCLRRLTRLRSAVGERVNWSAGGETAGTEPERNAAAEPQTEARR